MELMILVWIVAVVLNINMNIKIYAIKNVLIHSNIIFLIFQLKKINAMMIALNLI